MPRLLNGNPVRRTMKSRDTNHPIIDRPWEYSICEFRYVVGSDDEEDFVDLDLTNGSVVRRLRFLSPQGLEIESGVFPKPTGGMVILDVLERQMDGLGVQVNDFEGTHGAVKFWARDVIDRDTLGAD